MTLPIFRPLPPGMKLTIEHGRQRVDAENVHRLTLVIDGEVFAEADLCCAHKPTAEEED